MTKSDVQTSLRLPEELRERLAQAAAENGRGIGEEMRRRLEASFDGVPSADDPKTADLLAAVLRLTREAGVFAAEMALLERDGPEPRWHETPFAVAVVRAGLPLLIRAPAEPIAAPEDSLVSSIYGPEAKPEAVAQGIAGAVFIGRRS